MTKKIRWTVLSTLFILISLWILIFRMNDVQGNLEASFITMVPAFVSSHVLLHRKINQVHQSIKDKNGSDSKSAS